MSLFKERYVIWPEKYPTALEIVDAINQCYWLHNKWDFQSDIQDFHVNLNDDERNTLKNTILAISQIEVDVKTFWRKLGDIFKHPEIDALGTTLGENEVRHYRTYRAILEKMGLQEDFKNIINIPEIKKRMEYLKEAKVVKLSDDKHQQFALILALFTIFIEGASLFGGFFIGKSFSKHKNLLKDLDSAIQFTQKEETLHLLAGVWLLNELKKEHPEWFGEEFNNLMISACKKAYAAEVGLLDWIFERGDLSFLKKETVANFVRYRFNECMGMVGISPLFEVDEVLLKEAEWFITELVVQVQPDFFYKKTSNYSKFTQSITEESLF